MRGTPTTAVISYRDIRHGPWTAHALAMVELMASAFDAETLLVQPPSSRAQQLAMAAGRRLDLVRRFPGRPSLRPTIHDVGPVDLLFVVAHDVGDLEQLYASEPDWLDDRSLKILVLIEVWADDARRWPDSFARVLPHFDAVFCTLEEGIEALSEAGGCAVQVLPQAVDVLRTPFRPEPVLDVLTIGRRAPAQHELISRWADEHDGWYHFDTLPAGDVADVTQHRQVMAMLLAESAVSICNYARFDDTSRIGSTRATGTRFFETLASGAIIAGDLPTDQMFTDEFGEAKGIASFPLDCGDLDVEFVDEIVALGRRADLRRSNRAHALGHQDLAHRIRQVLEHVDVALPGPITERLAALDAARSALLAPA